MFFEQSMNYQSQGFHSLPFPSGSSWIKLTSQYYQVWQLFWALMILILQKINYLIFHWLQKLSTIKTMKLLENIMLIWFQLIIINTQISFSECIFIMNIFNLSLYLSLFYHFYIWNANKVINKLYITYWAIFQQ